MANEIDIVTVDESRINAVDFDNIDFGREFTDHMFSCDFINGAWQTPKIMPYQALTLDPSARVFHYGQAVFEGMKAFKDENDDVWIDGSGAGRLCTSAGAASCTGRGDGEIQWVFCCDLATGSGGLCF